MDDDRPVHRDHERCYRIVEGRDARFDGCFVTAVRTTGIYCRPSCPARTPKRTNVEFFASSAAAQVNGYRACKRCRPDASPGSPEWNVRSDVVARAVRLVADGLVDREGVGAVAARLGYSERQLHRLLVAELGAGALALARSQRAQNARILVETTGLPMVDVAFAAGFSSLRQFNDTIREVFDATPTSLRVAARRRDGAAPDAAPGPTAPLPVSLRLAHRRPLASAALWDFLSYRCVTGVETMTDGWYRRSLRLPHGHGVVDLAPADGHVAAVVRLADVRDLTAAVARCRRLLDLDADPQAVDERLALDPALAPLVARRPGLRSPGAVDGFEVVLRAILGQQVTVRASVHALALLAADVGEPLDLVDAELTHLVPTPAAIAAIDPATLPMPRRRAAALVALGDAVATGRVVLDAGADRDATRDALLAIPGIGPWTADYVAMRALADPDVLADRDLVVRQRLELLGVPAADVGGRSSAWAPWRTSVVHHLWAATPDELNGIGAAA